MLETDARSGSRVLIETYWNVKFYEVLDYYLEMSINRNILECKALSSYCV